MLLYLTTKHVFENFGQAIAGFRAWTNVHVCLYTRMPNVMCTTSEDLGSLIAVFFKMFYFTILTSTFFCIYFNSDMLLLHRSV